MPNTCPTCPLCESSDLRLEDEQTGRDDGELSDLPIRERGKKIRGVSRRTACQRSVFFAIQI
jgi:hypothetical protein